MTESKKIYSPTRTLNKLKSLGQYGEIGDSIGKGAYGEVYLLNTVAVKSSYRNKESGLNASSQREISILINLKHINIVPILDVFTSEYKINIVLEKADGTLRQYIDNFYGTENYQYMIKIYTYQLVRAVAYCHSNGIIHRDIKPQNILLYGNDLLKLADFGMARSGLPTYIDGKYDSSLDPDLTTEVATFWYRSPELLLGTKKYSYTLDNWSMGCVIAEMINNKTLFRGNDEKSMLIKIFKLLGTPDNKSWPDVESFPNYQKIIKKDINRMQLKIKSFEYHKKINKNIPKIEKKSYNIPLIKGLLTLNPNNRLLAHQALNNDFFIEIRDYIDKKYISKPIVNSHCHEILLLREEPIYIKLSGEIDNKMRWTLISWLYNVKIHFGLTSRTFYLTVHIIDKYVSLLTNLTLKDYLIILAGALGLACDYEEINIMSINELIAVADEIPNKAELIEIKENIWCALNYNLMFSLTHDFGILYNRSANTPEWLYFNFKDNLLKITICKEFCNPIFLNIMPHDLVLSLIIVTYELENQEIPQGCFQINDYHHKLSKYIKDILPNVKLVKF